MAPRRSSGATTKRAYHHGDLRRGLMDAALALVAEGGLPALSLREAARRAGVSPAAPYHHFPSREALVAALARDGFEGMRIAMERELAKAGDDPIERLLASGRGYVTYAIAHPASFQIMFGAARLCDLSSFPDVVAASEPVGSTLMESVARVSQLPGMPPIDLAKFGLFAWSSVHGASWLVLDGALKPEMTSGVALDDALANVETFGVMLRALASRANETPAETTEKPRAKRRQSVK